MDQQLMDFVHIAHQRLDELWAEFVEAQPTDWQINPEAVRYQLDYFNARHALLVAARVKLLDFARACDRIPETED